jgi:hypothetical protein
LGEGDIGGCVCFGAPITHRMFGLSLAWHWHGFGWQVHWSSHSGIVCSCGWLLKCHAFVSVKNLVFLLACSVWVIRWTALLCRAILSPLRKGCSHEDSKWGHVSRSFLWHSLQLGFWCVVDQNMFICGYPYTGRI